MNQGTFTATAHGGKTLLDIECKFSLEKDKASIHVPYFELDSNSCEFRIKGLPQYLQPAFAQVTQIALARNDGGTVTDVLAQITPSDVGEVSFLRGTDPKGWSVGGAKSIGAVIDGITYGVDIAYCVEGGCQ